MRHGQYSIKSCKVKHSIEYLGLVCVCLMHSHRNFPARTSALLAAKVLTTASSNDIQ